MQELERYDTDELEKELERRKQEKEKAEEADKPQAVSNPDWSSVKRMCGGYIEALHVSGSVRNDTTHYIFEAAMEAVFGSGVWGWINERL